MKIPNWYEAILLALAAFRVFHLLAEDVILDRPRRWFLRLGDWRQDGDKYPDGYRAYWGEFLVCGWCAGFWITLVWWGSFQWSPHWSIVIAVPWALSAVVGLIVHFSSE